jgi:hypothetical protein
MVDRIWRTCHPCGGSRWGYEIQLYRLAPPCLVPYRCPRPHLAQRGGVAAPSPHPPSVRREYPVNVGVAHLSCQRRDS